MDPGYRGLRHRRERAQAASQVIHGLAARIPRPHITVPRGLAAQTVELAGFAAIVYGVWRLDRVAAIILAGVIAVVAANALNRTPPR